MLSENSYEAVLNLVPEFLKGIHSIHYFMLSENLFQIVRNAIRDES